MKTKQLFVDNIEIIRGDADATSNKAFADMNEGSITPRTFKSRKFENSLDDLWFRDEYSVNDNQVTFFGINEKKISNEQYEKINANILRVKKRDASSVNSKNYTDAMTQEVEHTSLEKNLILKGLEYLLKEDNSTVLVDIFERERSMIIQLEKENYVHTHTVLLYKNPVDNFKASDSNSKSFTEIIVIDPNNFIYSSHLQHITNDEIFKSLQFTNPFKIVTRHITLPIYKSVTDKHRDCTDICVKLALWLNDHNNETVDLDNIKELSIVKLLSNQTGLAGITIDEKLPIRIKQTSSLEIVQGFNNVEEVISKTQNALSSIDLDKYLKIKSAYQKMLSELNCEQHSIDLSNLVLFSKSCLDEYKACIDSYKDRLDNTYSILKDVNSTLSGYIMKLDEEFIVLSDFCLWNKSQEISKILNKDRSEPLDITYNEGELFKIAGIRGLPEVLEVLINYHKRINLIDENVDNLQPGTMQFYKAKAAQQKLNEILQDIIDMGTKLDDKVKNLITQSMYNIEDEDNYQNIDDDIEYMATHPDAVPVDDNQEVGLNGLYCVPNACDT